MGKGLWGGGLGGVGKAESLFQSHASAVKTNVAKDQPRPGIIREKPLSVLFDKSSARRQVSDRKVHIVPRTIF